MFGNVLVCFTVAALLGAATPAGADPVSGAAALEDARARLSAGRHDEALKSFEAAFSLGYMPHEAAFGAAEAAAAAGEPEKAIHWLKNAAQSGFRDYARVRESAAFRELLADDAFAAVLDELDARAHPCRAAEYRALDFWVGTWNVRDRTTGNPAGTSRIDLDMDDCVVVENWTGRTGWTGRSFNVFRRETGRWQQTWADSSGQIYDFEGVASTDRMVYTRLTRTREGGERMIRMTLSKTSDGSVRQLSERSDDGGKTWAVNYDFMYVSKD